MTDAVNRETPPARGHETIGDWLGDHWDHTTHAVSTGIEHLAGHDTATPPAAAAITTSAETAAASPAITQETNVNLTEFRQIAERVENIGEETITHIEQILASPETRTILPLLAQAAGIPLPPGFITALGGMLATVVPPQPAPLAQQPAA